VTEVMGGHPRQFASHPLLGGDNRGHCVQAPWSCCACTMMPLCSIRICLACSTPSVEMISRAAVTACISSQRSVSVSGSSPKIIFTTVRTRTKPLFRFTGHQQTWGIRAEEGWGRRRHPQRPPAQAVREGLGVTLPTNQRPCLFCRRLTIPGMTATRPTTRRRHLVPPSTPSAIASITSPITDGLSMVFMQVPASERRFLGMSKGSPRGGLPSSASNSPKIQR
jgi:hypothetical protein